VRCSQKQQCNPAWLFVKLALESLPAQHGGVHTCMWYAAAQRMHFSCSLRTVLCSQKQHCNLGFTSLRTVIWRHLDCSLPHHPQHGGVPVCMLAPLHISCYLNFLSVVARTSPAFQLGFCSNITQSTRRPTAIQLLLFIPSCNLYTTHPMLLFNSAGQQVWQPGTEGAVPAPTHLT
jgi:hypothetical protein